MVLIGCGDGANLITPQQMGKVITDCEPSLTVKDGEYIVGVNKACADSVFLSKQNNSPTNSVQHIEDVISELLDTPNGLDDSKVFTFKAVVDRVDLLAADILGSTGIWIKNERTDAVVKIKFLNDEKIASRNGKYLAETFEENKEFVFTAVYSEFASPNKWQDETYLGFNYLYHETP